jgi:hypothetical protein
MERITVNALCEPFLDREQELMVMSTKLRMEERGGESNLGKQMVQSLA